MRYEKGNFITVPNKTSLKKLDAHSQVLFLWLCSFADDKGQCYPSVNRLSECCGLSRNTVIDRVKVLIGRGFLSKTYRYSDNTQKSNLYQIHLIPSATDTPPRADEVKKVVQEIHPPSAGDEHRTKSNELNINKEKRKAHVKNLKEYADQLFNRKKI